ncbi:epimerase domain-containing protein [Favolaschia claudopus]|uniref:Epimerase domain-containing protein n=1 Tax=Favolaschia claudopus TaxID=2862362 RepID=A0AAV9ZLB5_9AGAR
MTTTNACLALVKDQRCAQHIAQEYKWCSTHHQAERKHYNTYKRSTFALENFDDSSICVIPGTIKICRSTHILSRWAKNLREKLTLIDKCIRGREYHHTRFHAGGDSAHLHYLSSLRVHRDETETALLAVNLRHDALSGVSAPDPKLVDDEKVAAVLGWDAQSDASSEESYTDHYAEARRLERTRLLQQLFAFHKVAALHQEDTRAHFIDYIERLIILAILDRSALRTLLDSADPRTTVEAFLQQENTVTLEELKQIYVAVHLTPPHEVFRAINDAFRLVHDKHDVVLGRRIFVNESTDPICLAEWDLFEDVMPCRHCALQACHRLDEWAKVERLATLSLRFISWQPDGVAGFSRADTLFHLSGVFAERKWEQYSPKPYKKHGVWIEIQRPAGLYLKFALENADTYHRFMHVIQNLPAHLSVLGWAPAFPDSSADSSGPLIPILPKTLSASRMRSAPTVEMLPSAPWEDTNTLHEKEARMLYETSRDPCVLHMVVLDRTQGSLARLKDNLALAFLFAEHGHGQHDDDGRQQQQQTPRAFVAGEMRRLLDTGMADWGPAQAGLMGVACGAIAVPGSKSFGLFKERCVKLVETLGDVNLVVLWRSKKRKRKQKGALDCWESWKKRLDRMVCSRDLFYLGTEEGKMHLRGKLGRSTDCFVSFSFSILLTPFALAAISPTEGALVVFDEDVSREVFQRAFDRSEAVEKMIPPRKIPMDWDSEVEYPEEMNDDFTFMHEGFIEETMATIVEVQNELTVY